MCKTTMTALFLQWILNLGFTLTALFSFLGFPRANAILHEKASADRDPLPEGGNRRFVVLLDIAFVPDDPSHGFLLGTRQTLLETKDGGSTWAPRSISSAEDEDFNYRFNSTSFKGKEGWIISKPAILLYTVDSGDTWKRIPLTAQLPGDILVCVYESLFPIKTD